MKNKLRFSEISTFLLWVVFGLGIPADLLVPKVNAADIDIRQAGARCDGSDDAAPVQAALDSLTDGSRLVAPCRAYIGPAGLRLRRKNNIIVEGVDGGGFVALAGNPEMFLFLVEYCDGCVIRGLYLDSNKHAVVPLKINFSTEARIEGNRLYNPGYPASAAIFGWGNRRNVYDSNTILTTGVQRVDGVISDGVRGIWLGSQAIEWDPVITNNRLNDIGATAIAVNGHGAVVTGNYVDGTEGSGVKISPPAGLATKSVVQWNTLRNNRFSGVQIDNSEGPAWIRENTLEQNQVAGVYVSGGSFTEGEISGNRIAGSGEAGIYIYNGSRVLIEENDITGGGKAGIVFESQSGSIQDVRMHANTFTNVLGNGIIMLGRGGSIRGITLNSNSFSYIRQYGLAIEAQSAGAIGNPTLIGNCFANVDRGTLLDTRPQGGLAAPASAASCSKLPPSRFQPMRINVGGAAVSDARRKFWLADNDMVEGLPYAIDASITNTDTPELYRTGRWNGGKLEYTTTVPNRLYTVTLKFAETLVSQRGQRVFDIYINGELLLPAFDILANGAPFEAVDKTFRVSVLDGKLSIRLVSRVENPIINAIEIQ
jgi:parallel beta-helix repeat protein